MTNENALVPIQVNQSAYNPIATQNVNLTANLPASPPTGTATTTIIAYDSLGTAHSVTLNWTQVLDPASTTVPPAILPNIWNFRVEVPDANSTLADGTTLNYTNAGEATVTFGVPGGAAAGATLPKAGTIESIAPVTIVGSEQVTQGLSTAGPPNHLVTVAPGGSVAKGLTYKLTDDDGTGSQTGTTIIAVPPNATSGSPLVPAVASTTLTTTSASDTTKNVADSTVTYTETDDYGTAGTFSGPTQPTVQDANTGTVITTTSIPPVGNKLGGGGTYISGATSQPAATLSFITNFGSGDQKIDLNLGSFGATTGVTQFAGQHLKPAWPYPGRRSARRFLRRDNPGQRRHRCHPTTTARPGRWRRCPC